MGLPQDQPSRPVGRFPPTDWYEVGQAGDLRSQSGQTALEKLLRRYQPLVLHYLAERHSVPMDEAEDLWQGFVAKRVLGGEWFSAAAAARCRFRTFLLNSLDYHVRSELRRARARKRSPGTEMLSLQDVGEHQLPGVEDASDPETELFWERTVIAEVLLAMRQECEAEDCLHVWRVFEARILEPIFQGSEPPPYRELIRQIGLASPAQAANALTTAKRMFKRHLHRVIGTFAGDEAAVAEELRHYLALLDPLS